MAVAAGPRSKVLGSWGVRVYRVFRVFVGFRGFEGLRFRVFRGLGVWDLQGLGVCHRGFSEGTGLHVYSDVHFFLLGFRA